MKSLCTISDCGAPVAAKGYCSKHYQRFKTHGSPFVTKRMPPGTFSTCTVDGCNRPHLTGGCCNMHYCRAHRRGEIGPAEPLLAKDGEPSRWVAEVAIGYAGDDCLRFPFSLANGYGQVWIKGRKYAAHRYICAAVNGPAPDGHAAAHECGNSWCVNPRHLAWKTYADNEADKIRHGTYLMRPRRLTEQQVIDIRRASGPHDAIARAFGCSRRLVGMIKSRKVWAWLQDEAAA